MCKISEVTFYPIRPTEKGLIGFASCLFNNKLAISSIGVYTTFNGDIRLLFPDRTLPNGRKLADVYPIDQETYNFFKEAIKKKIETVTKDYGEHDNARSKR
jgi:hypothetical protein